MKRIAIAAGDVALAKLAHRWEGELLGELGAEGGAEIVDLAQRKRERE